MASVYSQRFIALHAGANTVFTVPTGFRAVVRDISAFNGSAFVPETAQLYHEPSGATFYLVSVLPQTWTNSEVRVVLEEGEEIHTSNGTDIDMIVGGYLLTLP